MKDYMLIPIREFEPAPDTLYRGAAMWNGKFCAVFLKHAAITDLWVYQGLLGDNLIAEEDTYEYIVAKGVSPYRQWYKVVAPNIFFVIVPERRPITEEMYF